MSVHSIDSHLFEKIPNSDILYHKCIGNQQGGESPNRELWIFVDYEIGN